MLISEIFYSVQGEGLLTGVPSVFIRTSGCNLRCRWCDTPYASWKPVGNAMEPEAVLGAVQQFPAARHVVLTGGEPMVAKEVGRLIDLIREAGYHLTIETAGTVPPAGGGCDLASISPKLSNSTPLAGEISSDWITKHEKTRLQPAVLREWWDHARELQLKFVISSEADLLEANQVMLDSQLPIPPDRILLMPEGRSVGELQSRAHWLVEQCKASGYRFCHRLHIELFGNTPGT